MVVERHIDADIFDRVRDAAIAAYRAAAIMVADRMSTSLVAAAGQVISEAEWAAILIDVEDAYGDAYLDAVISGGIDLGILPADTELVARAAAQAESVEMLASGIRELLDQFLQTAIEEHITPETLRSRLLTAPSSPLNPRKAEMFARTATTTAVNSGFASAFKAAGVPFVSWVTQRDERVRDTHEAVDRDVVANGTPFTLRGGYEAMFPGDPQLPIALRISCRCMLGYVDGEQVRHTADARFPNLYNRAKTLNIPGRSKMRKPELQAAVIQAMCLQGLAGGTDCPDRFDDMNMTTLLTHARVADIGGRWRMRRPELVEAVHTAYRTPVPTGIMFSFNPNQSRHAAGSIVGGRWRRHYDAGRYGPGEPVRTWEADDRPSIFQPDEIEHFNEERERIARYEREHMVHRPASREERERFNHLHGRGVDALFTGPSAVTSLPFPSASRKKTEDLYDRQVVIEALKQDVRLTNFDPRTLVATQPGVTRPGVRFYMDRVHSEAGHTYADRGKPGNRHPIVYRNPNSGELMILSGHHRATAALLRGENVAAIYIDPRIRVIRPRRLQPADR